MKFTECNIEDIRDIKIGYRRTKNLKLLDAFIASGIKCAKVEEYSNKHAYSLCASLSNSIRKIYHLNSIEAHVFHGEVYLINTAID
jgi:hypothetical protein